MTHTMDNLKQVVVRKFKLLKNNFINKNKLTKINQPVRLVLKNQSMVAKLKSFITTYLPVFSKLTPLTYTTISMSTISIIAALAALDAMSILSVMQLA
jgi:hypothetical protein